MIQLKYALLIRDNTLAISCNVIEHIMYCNVISINHVLCRPIFAYVSRLYGHPVQYTYDVGINSILQEQKRSYSITTSRDMK